MKNLWVYLLLIASASFWGGNFNAGKLVVDTMTPFTSAALRFCLAGLLMLIIWLVREKIDWTSVRQNLWAYILLGIIGVFGFNVLFFIGLKHTSAVNGSLIMACNPLFTVILSVFILGTKISKRQGFGMLISLLGVVAVITKGSVSGMSFSAGDFIIIAGNICWALYGVLGKKWLKNSTPMAMTAITMVFGAILMVPFAFGETHPVPLSAQSGSVWWAIAFMAVCGSVLAYLWWNIGIAKIGAGNTSIFFNLVPVATMVISLVTGASVSTLQVIGAVLVIGGVLFASGIKLGKVAGATAGVAKSQSR